MTAARDPRQYQLFGEPRARPFADLLARVEAVRAETPRVVVDLGCGDGPLTIGLTQRWPRARVVGVDSSPSMLDRARELDADGAVEWVLADVRDWHAEQLGTAPDLIVTNAALQWVPGHERLIGPWLDALAPGGVFALQVPANFDAPSHALMREVAARQPRADELVPALRREVASLPSAAYLGVLAEHGLEADVWDTTYLHVLDPAGEQTDPVLEWVRATGLRPVLALLTEPGEREAFLCDYSAQLRLAYPRMPWGVVLPFTRRFAVGRRPD